MLVCFFADDTHVYIYIIVTMQLQITSILK